MSVVPFAWRARPSLIERVLPAQKISAEAQKERKAGAGQTLTSLGSYWKGRKPLILVKACVLGALLPASDDLEVDLAVFEKLMAIDDEAFLRREFRPSCLDLVKRLHARREMRTEEAEALFEVRRRASVEGKSIWENVPFRMADLESLKSSHLIWRESVIESERYKWELLWVQSFGYLDRVSDAKRPEELNQDELFEPVWGEINRHLGTCAASIPELVEQIGILRFGRRPKIGDTFCGGGSIPFEAARLGCDVYASDLNPIACMLTWGALNIIGASPKARKEIEQAQAAVAAALDREITAMGIEHDSDGNRAKAYLYCLEVRCPQTGWMVPLAPSWVISKTRNVIARLKPDYACRRFNIEIFSAVSGDEMREASVGTMQDGDVVYTLDGETYRTNFKTIRGDVRAPSGPTNKLRRWEKMDFKPRPDDILQERLYCIQWVTRDTLDKPRQTTFFTGVTGEDLERERKVEDQVRGNLENWQQQGLVPDMEIELGDETARLIRERGWTHWHHLFNARQLLGLSVLRRGTLSSDAYPQTAMLVNFCIALDNCSRLCSWNPGHPGSGEYTAHVFYNQALNTFVNYSARSVDHICKTILSEAKRFSDCGGGTILPSPAAQIADDCDIYVTDPPYADAVNYHEITEFFIAWIRQCPPPAFASWVWDSFRTLAIKGETEEFRRGMVAAYGAMTRHMPDYGVQIVMFTHQDASVWADMAAIVWGSGLQVTAAWYIATETTSEIKKGGYVQGTVLLVLQKRAKGESVYRDELVQEVRTEVARQIETMTGLNQSTKGAGRSENLFEDADLQMAGYAAALRVLTGYSCIDGQDMGAEAIRPRQKGGRDLVKEIIDFAVQVANEHLVPDGIPATLWERLSSPERFYLKMLDIEAAGLRKIDNYQNFAKAFRYGDYNAVMASTKANDARLKTALDLKRTEFESEFGKSPLRAVLFALYELQIEVDIDEVTSHLRDLIPGYLTKREDLMALASVVAAKREGKFPQEAQAARILLSRIRNERLG